MHKANAIVILKIEARKCVKLFQHVVAIQKMGKFGLTAVAAT